jgi:Sec-independent protein translocase protein TatA
MDAGIFGIGIWELGLIFIIMLAVAGPKRMVKWAFELGKITAKLRGMFQETMDAFKREIDASDLNLSKDLPKLPTQRFDIVKEANKLVDEAVNTPTNSKYSSSTSGNVSATTMTTATPPSSPAAPPAADDEQPRYDSWLQK